MVNRALIICSTYTPLAAEFNEIRRIGLKNDYPLSFIDNIIGIKLSQYRRKMNGESKLTVIRCDKKKMYVELPFIRSSTLELKKKIKHLSNKLRPDLDIQFFTKPPPSTQAFFKTKDPIVKHMQADVVYYIKCNDCSHPYIGKTERQCLRRLHEHGAPKTIYQQQQCNHVSDDLSVSNNIIELRRSSRIKNKTATVTTAPPPPTTDDDNNDNKIAKSSITRHEKETGHHMDWNNFQVTWQDNHYYRLLIKESLFIKTYEPELNKTTHSVPLLVFPDGLPRVLLPNPDL
ncbi:unnamed protein product [Rotaria sordida]|uniref:Helix-turn-helix domain-containing protein n=1 Tax=Rotaria sordida TaxID=392033 RepID=A0A818RBT4_9BILA|nr:unnamed protein product [Rotaria sordida]CAF3650396.1 unnamed protein product [Rotaria sordida]